MWLSPKLVGIVEISKDTVDNLRTDLAKMTAERDLLKAELATTKANWGWAIQQINDLQLQNKSLMYKAYNVSVPVPEIVRPLQRDPMFNSDLFEDMGEERAKREGMPLYDPKSN